MFPVILNSTTKILPRNVPSCLPYSMPADSYLIKSVSAEQVGGVRPL
jgi:hypothetical protein